LPRRYLDGALNVIDHELAFVAVAGEYAAMLGWQPRDLVGVPALELVDLDESQARAAHEARMRIIDAGGAVDDVATLIARDGARIMFAHTARAVMDGALYVVSGEPLPSNKQLELIEPRSLLIGEWLTKAEAAAYAKVSASTLERAVHAGELTAGGTHGRRRFRREWLDAWLIGLGTLIALLVALCVLACADVIELEVSHHRGTPTSVTHHRDNERAGQRERHEHA